MRLIQGDNLASLKDLPDNSIDSIVTDPPYGLKFMGKHWDHSVPSVEIWKECLRVLKPGGHLLSFGGTRTYHRLVVNIEDAGFEIRDQIQWIYGSGFPKSLNVSKAIDKEAGAEREVVGSKLGLPGYHLNANEGNGMLGAGISSNTYDTKLSASQITAPATDLAKQWDGWGTALKPANEPICLARKPLSESTVAKNVVKWGTGAINVDECRIGLSDNEPYDLTKKVRPNVSSKDEGVFSQGSIIRESGWQPESGGRWPANVLFDEEAAEVLDEQTGVLKSGAWNGVINKACDVKSKGAEAERIRENRAADSGGASRFFYVAKSSKRERGEGNGHPTVKPIKLMEYLVTLITPPGGTVLDPFMGSGTTGIACKNKGFRFVGMELSEEYFEIAKRRIG